MENNKQLKFQVLAGCDGKCHWPYRELWILGTPFDKSQIVNSWFSDIIFSKWSVSDVWLPGRRGIWQEGLWKWKIVTCRMWHAKFWLYIPNKYKNI